MGGSRETHRPIVLCHLGFRTETTTTTTIMADHMDMDDSDRVVVDQPNADHMDIEQPPSPSPCPWWNQLAVPFFYTVYRRRRGAFSLVPLWLIVPEENQIVNSFLIEQPWHWGKLGRWSNRLSKSLALHAHWIRWVEFCIFQFMYWLIYTYTYMHMKLSY